MKETTQPPAKWTKRTDIPTMPLTHVYYQLENYTRGADQSIMIPISLVEQLQSEAEERGYRKKLPPHLNIFIDEQIKEKIEEARADERKKVLSIFDRMCREHSKMGFELELDPVKLGKFTGTLYKKLKLELEQPVEHNKECYCIDCIAKNKKEWAELTKNNIESKEDKR